MHITTSSIAVTSYSSEEITRVWGSQSMSTSLDSACPGQQSPLPTLSEQGIYGTGLLKHQYQLHSPATHTHTVAHQLPIPTANLVQALSAVSQHST